MNCTANLKLLLFIFIFCKWDDGKDLNDNKFKNMRTKMKL